MANYFSFQIAGISFSIKSRYPADRIGYEKAYSYFLKDCSPDIRLTAHYEGGPELDLKEENLIFDSEMLWRLYKKNDKYFLLLNSIVAGPEPYRYAVFSNNFLNGDIYSRKNDISDSPQKPLPNPFEFPLSEVLMINLLGKNRGILVHSCGVVYKGDGYIFAGNSTHGKTTIAGLWGDDADILNDDRIIIRKDKSGFRIYGTPWHGDNRKVSSDSAPLKRIFFLKHSEKNYIKQKKGAVASSMLLSRIFPPLWDHDGMGFTLGFCNDLVSSVQCFELGFVPDKNIIEMIKCSH